MENLKKRIYLGEDSYTQFKVNITNSEKLAEELVAFSNAKGGLLIIGVDDKAEIVGLSSDDIRRLNQLIGNVINANLTPPIYPLVSIKEINNKNILVIEIDEGVNKPYSTNKGLYITKAGSDKRKISPEELKRLFAESKKLYADEEIIKTSDITDLNSQLFYRFLRVDNKTVYNELKAGKLSFEYVLQNLELLRNGHLTIAGNLIFGLEPQRFCPSFYVDAVYFDGNDITTNKFISKATLKGTFEKLYDDSLSFITTKLRTVQKDKNFNSNGILEIDEEVLGELIINALVHRDYYINSSIKIFMFHNRVEIISPGKLTNSLTIEKIKSGISIHRNPILNSICKTVLPYSGYGSGIKRVININPDIEFINDIEKEEFRCIIPRF
ncbi:RNA-binding domain-containing protein [Candidatus Marithrix sp. Canyon 246]|uniref:RNA-binding domain-containing protein n=1 Tax=Candidatus Marithrix sp. Canyon 246 TaxID=1827136 RepID=UPI00084A109A|nr:RNA-binding domain-containing protein [Candidatus Marithrix sp. Canyon 246]